MVSEWQIMCAEFLTQCWEKVPPIITSPCPLHTWLRRLDHCPYSDCVDVLRLFPRHSLDFAANYSCYKHSYDADIGEGNIEGAIYASFLEILFLSVCLPFSLSLSLFPPSLPNFLPPSFLSCLLSSRSPISFFLSSGSPTSCPSHS